MLLGYIDPGSGFTIFSLGSWVIAFLLGFLGMSSLFFKKIYKFIKKYRKLTLILIILAILLIFLIIGVTMIEKEMKFDKKVIILGFDGLSPQIIESMINEGELVNFARLKEHGSYSRLSTTNPPQSPVAWTGFATGQNPGKNGIFDFIIRDPKTYRLALSTSNIEKGKPKRVTKTKCFWQYTSQKKIPTVIITCPITFPPDKIYGRLLSGMGVPDMLGTEGTFTFYTTEAVAQPANNRSRHLPKSIAGRVGKDVGGKVEQIEKSPKMTLNLIGPRIARLGSKPENTKVPFNVTLGKDGAIMEYQNNKFQLKVGRWSGWKKVTFNLGFSKKAKGILKFYLVEIEPEFKLYISPINFDPREPFFSISYPENYSRNLADDIGLYHSQGMPMDTWAVNEKRLNEEPFLEQVNEVLKEKKAMLDFELNRFKGGVLFCYFGSSDTIQHMFWRYIDYKHPLYEKDAPWEYKSMIKTWYKKMDDILGSVMVRINENDTLIVLSDHGFNTFRRTVHINSWLRKNGYLELKNPNAKSGSELLEDIDWSKTKAYSIGFGAIYINKQGREQYGIVKPGEETELLKEKISQKLKRWADEKYNTLIINKVYKGEEIFWGDYVNETPELYIGFNIGYRASWQTALGGVPDKLIEDNLKKWSGDHLFDPALIPGVIFCNKKITKEKPSIYDIAPTILKITGSDERKLKNYNFDGEPLF